MSTEIKEINRSPSSTDRKVRWGGVLENPLISKIQRNILDGGRVFRFKRLLEPYSFRSVLDVSCGLGEYTSVNKDVYTGLDNSFRRLQYAAKKYQQHSFLSADATQLPFPTGTFDVSMFIDTAHHFSDTQFHQVLVELKRVSKKYIVLADSIVTENQGRLSSFFYRLDRGACFRNAEQMKQFIDRLQGVSLVDTMFYRTFPGFYHHAAFILAIGA